MTGPRAQGCVDVVTANLQMAISTMLFLFNNNHLLGVALSHIPKNSVHIDLPHIRKGSYILIWAPENVTLVDLDVTTTKGQPYSRGESCTVHWQGDPRSTGPIRGAPRARLSPGRKKSKRPPPGSGESSYGKK